jgi:hypothetical protein
MNKQEIINELSRLYTLQREGKKVKSLIRQLEEELWEVCDDELDKELNKKEKKYKDDK